jgi:hypothetical protein
VGRGLQIRHDVGVIHKIVLQIVGLERVDGRLSSMDMYLLNDAESMLL